MNHELPYIQAGFRKGRGTRDQIANVHWIIEKAKEFQKNIYFLLDYAKAFDCVNVTQSCPTLRYPMDYTVQGTFQARILEWVAFPFSRGSYQPRDQTQIPHCRWILYQLSHQGSPRILEWVAHLFASRSSRPRNQTKPWFLALQVDSLPAELPGTVWIRTNHGKVLKR